MRAAFHEMKNIWASPSLTINIKIRIFNTAVKSVLLYGAETWRTMTVMLKKIQTFINTCHRRNFQIQWPSATLEMDQETTSRGRNPPKILEMDWTHPRKANVPHVKPWPGIHRERGSEAAPEHLASGSGGWNTEDGLHQGTTWEAGPGQGCLETSCTWPMP